MSFGIGLISRYLELLRVAAAGSWLGTLMPAVAGATIRRLRSPLQPARHACASVDASRYAAR
jgi:hypothetical protein